jgi:hypothetical protein
VKEKNVNVVDDRGFYFLSSVTRQQTWSSSLEEPGYEVRGATADVTK